MKTINVGLVGITGYAGMELARLLAGHPFMRLTAGCSRPRRANAWANFIPSWNICRART